jgi:hypothetical protein
MSISLTEQVRLGIMISGGLRLRLLDSTIGAAKRSLDILRGGISLIVFPKAKLRS